MGIVITGASGFVGRDIVPILLKSEKNLLLVGRDKERLQAQFPNALVSDYDNLAVAAKGFDTLVHLAVHNNDQPGDIEVFRKANVEHLDAVLRAATVAGVKTIIYTTTTHAAKTKDVSPYGQSKREAEELLSQTTNMAVVNLRLPAVYGTTYSGKLKLLEHIPRFLRPIAFTVFSSLKPTVNTAHVAASVLAAANEQKSVDLIVSDQQAGNWFYATVKRMIDLSFVLFVAIFLWWAFIAAWIAIKLSSPGPGIFAQDRVGKDGTLFTCYKFRTMAVGTKQAGTHEVASDSVTNVGNFLRKTKIDELPQIWNILKNEMSLVGPRPCLPVQKELISARKKRGVLAIKGGITGWAQIAGIDMSDPVRLARIDAEYLALRCIVLDIKIILATATGHGQGDKIGR